MRRREFLSALVGGATVAWPLDALAQQSTRKIPRVGVLWHAGSAEEEAIYLGALSEGLKALGYVVTARRLRSNTGFPMRHPNGSCLSQPSLPHSNPMSWFAVTRPAAIAMQRATTTIPTVFIVVPDPVGMKLVKSLARPGGNVTGLTHIAVELSAKRLAYFKEAFPSASRAALLVNANDPQGMRRYVDESQVAAGALGITVQPVEVRSLGDFEAAFDQIVADRLEGVVVPADGLFYQGRMCLAQSALQRRLPLVVYSRETLEAGALMSYGADQRAIFRRAGVYVDKIFKGERPADLPVEQPTKFEFLINLKTATTLGLTIAPAVLARADEVTEKRDLAAIAQGRL